MRNWQFPRGSKYGRWQINRTRVADPQWTVGVNRIMGHPIGVYVITGSWLYGICRPIDAATRRQKQGGSL
jgi:hypothetical protein